MGLSKKYHVSFNSKISCLDLYKNESYEIYKEQQKSPFRSKEVSRIENY